jgi:hypothetical protein
MKQQPFSIWYEKFGLGVTKLPGEAATAQAMWEFFNAP